MSIVQGEASTPESIDKIYKLLRKKRKFEKLKMHFITVVGDYLIRQKVRDNGKWGLLESKQLLNAIRALILIKEDDDALRYYKLEDHIVGKWGYKGMQSIIHSFEQFWPLPNDIYTIRKLK